MKTLLLTLASLALLSTSIYAGCTATVDMDGNRITDLGAPTTGTDAVNKNYVDMPAYQVAINEAVITQGLIKYSQAENGLLCLKFYQFKNGSGSTFTDNTIVAKTNLSLDAPVSMGVLNLHGSNSPWIQINTNGDIVARNLGGRIWEAGHMLYGNYCVHPVN
jgi:hypothetical protein